MRVCINGGARQKPPCVSVLSSPHGFLILQSRFVQIMSDLLPWNSQPASLKKYFTYCNVTLGVVFKCYVLPQCTVRLCADFYTKKIGLVRAYAR
jgi:hypothetical protein